MSERQGTSPGPVPGPGGRLLVAFAAPADPGVPEILAQAGAEVIDHPPLAGEALAAAAAACDVLVTRAFQRVGRAVFEAGRGRLRAVVQGSAGIDNIDHDAAAACGIEVVAVDPGNATAVAELTLMSLVALWRDAAGWWQRTAAGAWPRNREHLPDHEAAGKTLGLVGFGRVGTRVARRALAGEMRVLAYDPHLDDAVFAAHGVERVATLAALLPRLDALSLHCPLTDETRGMVGAAEFGALPRGALFVNTARGGIADEAALAAALDAGHLAGAALDVFAREPVELPGIAAHPRVLATPHVAGHTVESHAARGRHLAEALLDLVRRPR